MTNMTDASDPRPAGPFAWNGLRKADLIMAIHDGRIGPEEACALYGVTVDEIALWERTLSSLNVRRK